MDWGQSEKRRASQLVPNFFYSPRWLQESVDTLREGLSLLSEEPCVTANTACPQYVQSQGNEPHHLQQEADHKAGLVDIDIGHFQFYGPCTVLAVVIISR